MSTSINHVSQKENSLSRYFASEGRIALGDILPQETK